MKNKSEQGIRGIKELDGLLFYIRWSQTVSLIMRHWSRDMTAIHTDIREKIIPGREKSNCKGPEAGTGLAC